MDIYDDMKDISRELSKIEKEIDDLKVIKEKLEHIEDFLINYTRGNYIRYLKGKNTN